MPAVAIAVGIVVWAPDEIARQYKFEKLRDDVFILGRPSGEREELVRV